MVSPDARIVRDRILTQRVPNTEIFEDLPADSTIQDCLLINCRVPRPINVVNCNMAQRLQYIETADVDGEIVVLQNVRFLLLGSGARGEVAGQTVDLARESLPSGAVELTERMFNQWRAGKEITLG